jgi:Zn-dependent protease with chaperone function
MNFFAAQEHSRRNTRRLLLIMSLAVAAVVCAVTAVITGAIWLGSNPVSTGNFIYWAASNKTLVVWIAGATTLFIGFASLYRVASLRQGGSKVARDLGGTLISAGDGDPLRRRLRNVVEEMSIASGVPTPEVYILDHESGINAFAAGFSIDDAAIAVTRGTLETLSRDELQGVIAHEFSHIFNGDMRLNIQLMGPMFGILSIGLLGRMLLRGGRSTGRSKGKGNGAAAALALGLGLIITGYVGLFLARLIKASVSRQREYLADASAVQYTRQTNGIAGALKKIAGYSEHSAIQDSEAEEVSHMLFASGSSALSRMLATHPPLLQRIQALDPAFTEQKLAKLQTVVLPAEGLDSDTTGAAGFAAAAPGNAPQTLSVAELYGQPDTAQHQIAQNFQATLPETISDALESGYLVMLLVPALILSADSAERGSQLNTITQQLGADRTERVAQFATATDALPSEARLIILNLALPLIKEQPAGRREYLFDLINQLATQNNRLSLFEYSLLRIYASYMLHAQQPAAQQMWRNLNSRPMLTAAARLLAIYAAETQPDPQLAANALSAGLTVIAAPAAPAATGDWSEQLDQSLEQLTHCTPRGREKIIDALVTIALFDRQLSQPESELLRAVCAMLQTPLPPLAVSAQPTP